MFGSTATIVALIGLVGFSIAAFTYGLFFNRISASVTRDRRVNAYAAVGAKGRKVDPAAARRRNVQDTLKEIEFKQKSKAARSTNPSIRLRLQQAGMKISVGKFYAWSVVAGMLGMALAGAAKMPVWLVLGCGFVAAIGLPRLVVNMKRKRRQKAFIEELPNAVEVIVRGVKAGLPLNDCLRMIAIDAKEPLRSEFRAIVEAQQLGVPTDEAVGQLFERMPLAEANFFAIVIAIQSRAGGNLSEALGNLSKVLRDRKKMRAKISAMSQEAKSSAAIIGALPIIVTVLVYLTSPDYISLLWTDPRGQVVVGCSALVMTMGVLVMRKMINFDF
jgi:tight adherence protein B